MLTRSTPFGARPCARLPPLAKNFMPFAEVGNAADGTFSGYASLFDTPDLGNDIISPGAFAESIARKGPRGVKLLFHHDAAQPIGVWHTLREDSRGLYVEGQLSLDNTQARDILALLRTGAIDGLSIGFRAVTATRVGKSTMRTLSKIDLWEISVVTFPMLPGARVTAVKTQPRVRSPTVTLTMPQRIQTLTAAIRANT
jgi:uncharacterized protein